MDTRRVVGIIGHEFSAESAATTATADGHCAHPRLRIMHARAGVRQGEG
jgi:hypothetical protein